MVTEMVVKESLSDQMIAAGSELTRRLGEAGLPVSAALWFYEPESNYWRFIIATPEVRTRGLKTIYDAVQSVVRAMPEDRAIPLKDISAVDSTDPLISLLKVAIRKDDGLSGTRFTRNMINGVLIEDSYIYRLT